MTATGEGPVGFAPLAVDGVSKTYPGTRALKDLSLSVRSGEVHAVIGENGAGKTTLLMILSGVLAPDSGRILLDGREVRFSGARDAQAAGIGTVFQELSLVDALTVAENVFVNRAPAGPLGWILTRRLAADTRGLLRVLGSDLRPDRRVASLRTGDRQMVEIAKALSVKARVLLMDEPTSALSIQETRTLFEVIRRLTAQGIGVVFVSHRLAEVFEIADRLSILRDGSLVGTYLRPEITPEQAVRLMVGRALASLYPERALGAGRPRLEVRGLRSGPVGPIDLTVHAGEIVGLAGLRGSGRSQLVRALFGIERRTAGSVLVDSHLLPPSSPRQAVRHRIAFVPSDRKEEGVFLRMTVAQNLIAAALDRVSRLGVISGRAVRQLASTLVRNFDIRSTGLDQEMARLSGGNQQKVVLARWLATNAAVLIVDEPTQGVDIGAKADIHAQLRRLAQEGRAVLMISSDLPEVLGMCDRIVVMARGNVQGVLDGREATEESVMNLAAGRGAA